MAASADWVSRMEWQQGYGIQPGSTLIQAGPGLSSNRLMLDYPFAERGRRTVALGHQLSRFVSSPSA